MSLRTCASCTTAYAADLRACPQCQCTDVAGDPSPVLSLPTVVVECSLADCPDVDKRREVRLKSAGVGVVEAPPLLCARCGSAMWTVKPWSPLEAEMAKITRHGGPTNARADEPGAATPEPIPPAEPVTGADATAATLTADLTAPAASPGGIGPSPLEGVTAELTEGIKRRLGADLAAFAEPREHPGTGEPTEGVGLAPDGVERDIGTPVTEEGGEGPSVGSSSSTSPTKPPPTPKPKGRSPRKRAPTTGNRSKRARTGSSTARSTDGSGSEEPDEGAG